MQQRTIDVHNHSFPWDYLQHLLERPGKVRAKQTGPHSYVMKCGNVIIGHIDRPGHYNIDARIRDLDKFGMDTQLISQTMPCPELLEPAEGVYWARRINDAYADAVAKHPHRLYAYASLPYQDVDAACKELERCYRDLKVVGVMMFSNCNGEPMHLPKYEPIFQMAAEYKLPILMHPTLPLTGPILDMMKIPYQLYGYIFETTLAVIGLIFHGTFTRHRNLKMIQAHLGGVAPYLVRRLQDSWKGYSKEWGLTLDDIPPDEIYQRQIYPDTTSFYLPAMKCCLDWVGAEHMMIGTDYAHRVGDPEGAIKSIKDLGEQAQLEPDQIDMILGKNAEKMFNLPPMPGRRGVRVAVPPGLGSGVSAVHCA